MSAAFSNEPSGATQRLDHAWNSTAGFEDVYRSTAIVTDGTAPLSPSNVARHRLEAFAKDGGGQIHYYLPGTYRDMFVGCWWKLNAGFQGRSVFDKMFFMRGPDSNGVFGLYGGPTKGGSFTLCFVHNSGNVDNSHTMAGHLGLQGFPNVGPATVTPGTWFKIEAYLKSSTTLTSRDGIVKWWVNGIPAGSYTNINYGPAGLNEWVWTETWDRSGDMGTVNTVAWEHYMDQLYISTGGTVGSGGTPPPEPDPTPPPQAVLASITPSNLSTVVGTSKQFTISMSAPVASNTSLFTTSSNTAVATVPDSVTIQSGSSSALVTATPVAVGSTTISTSYNGVTKAATLQVGTSGSTSGSTAYDYSAQFSGTQGQDNWYYLENDGTEMTYSGGSSTWTGSDTYGGNLQTIWGSGFHPGGTRATILRFVVPASGSADIDGSFYDLDTAGGTGAVARVMHNGVTLFTRTIANGDTTGGVYDLTRTVSAGDHIDFVVANQTADYQNNSTSLNPVITLAAVSTEPTPPPPPSPPASVVDFFTTVASVTAGTAFSMTVRLSETVSIDTAVEIRVGSTSILSAPTSVTVASGTFEKNFTVTPLAASLVAIEAVLNGTKRVTLNVQPAPSTTPPDIDTGPVTDPLLPTIVRAIIPVPDGASLILSQRALALAFKYDAQPEWVAITDFPPSSSEYVHAFTWPSGTTAICYRAKAIDGTWGASSCVPFVATPPTPPPPAVNKAVTDKAGIRWQLTGKKSPYELKRNGSTMDNTYGVALRKSGDGYMELLQANGVWIRRNGNSWEFVQ